MDWSNKSTIVRFKDAATKALFRYGEHVAPGRTGRLARDLWFSAPPRMPQLPVPEGGEAFEVQARGHVVRGMAWAPADAGRQTLPPEPGEVRTVYLVHGWGGRGAQFTALVQPLRDAGFRVVTFDAPSHGDSDHGEAGPGRTSGLEFGHALDAVFCRFGPAEAVVAHSMGTIATYLALRFGWLGTRRLVFVAPMVESLSLFDAFQAALGFGNRTRRAFDRAVDDFVGIAVSEFDARVQAAYVEPVPTLVIADRDDRQTPHADAEDFARSILAPLLTTQGLGHRKILRDPVVVKAVVDFVAEERALDATA